MFARTACAAAFSTLEASEAISGEARRRSGELLAVSMARPAFHQCVKRAQSVAYITVAEFVVISP